MPDTDTRRTVARLRHLRTSPTKVRPVLRLIAGQDVEKARDTLRLSDRAVSHEVGKVLDSAIANAEHNDNIPEDELYVAEAFADEGPTMKRWRPRARGRGTRIRKRTTHLTIVVARFDEAQLELRRRSEAGTTTRGGRRPTRRRTSRATPVEADHDHEHDEAEEAGEDAAATPAKATKSSKTTKKSTKKSTKKAASTTAKKATKASGASTTKKAAKTSTAKTSTTKKSTKKAAKATKKAPAKKRGDGDEN